MTQILLKSKRKFLIMIIVNNTASKVSKSEVFSGPNTGKYGPEKTSYLDTFHVVYISSEEMLFSE